MTLATLIFEKEGLSCRAANDNVAGIEEITPPLLLGGSENVPSTFFVLGGVSS